jgi:uncharacterized SAM-binding protein YcdF (DUF218 family)
MRAFFLGIIFGLLLAIAVGAGSLIAAGHYLEVENPLAYSDVIVAVSGDNGPRTETAVALWKQGYAPLLLFSGAALDPASVSSAELMKRDAVRLGVPADAILLEPASASTEENARFTAQLMADRGLHSAILVTSPYHQRRASLLFSRSFTPIGLTFRNYPARDPQWDPDRWWMREPSRTLTLVELAKLGATIIGGG